MAMTNAKLGLALVLALVLVAGTGALVYPGRSEKPRDENQGEKSASAKPAPMKQARTDRYGDPLPPGAIARIGTIRFRHGSTVNSVCYSPDGKMLASVGFDAIRLWDAATGRELHSYDRRPLDRGGFFSPDGRCLWLQSSEARQNSPGKEIYCWNLSPTPEREPKKAPFDGQDLLLLAASPDGKVLAISEKNTIRLCEIATGKDRRRLETHAYRACYSADGKVLASFDFGNIILWNVRTGEQIRCFRATDRRNSFVDFALAPDGKKVAALSRGASMSLHLWDTAAGKEIQSIQVPNCTFRALTLSPDGKILALAAQELLRTWDVSSGKMLWEHRGYHQFSSVAFSPDSKMLATGLRREVRRYDAASGRELPPIRDGEPIRFLRLLRDGQTLATVAQGKPLRMWRLPHLEEIPPYSGQKHLVVPEVSDVSPDGKWLASRSHKDRALWLWDIASGEVVHRLPHVQSPYGTFSPDSRWVQTHDVVPPRWESELRFWDVRTGKMVSELKGKHASVALFSPDSRLYATPGGRHGFSYIGSVPDVSLVRRIAVRNGSYRFAFSADGRLLAGIGSRDEPPCLWETASGKEIATISGKAGQDSSRSRLLAYEVAFSPNGRNLITGDHAGNLFCWDVEGRLLHQWKGDNFPIRVLSFTPDGKMLITGGDTTALVWDMDKVLPSEKRRSAPQTAAELNDLWADLKAEDATRAYRAVWKLAAAPDQAVPFLRERLRPAHEPDKTDTDRIAALIGDLDNDAFATREKAGRELAAFGKAAEPALRKALANGPSPESKRRIEELLRKLPESLPSPPPEQLRQLRALAVLEYAANEQAREALKSLSQGHPKARLTQEAKASLSRLSAQPSVRR